MYKKMFRVVNFILIFTLFIIYVAGEDVVVTINTKRSVHIVDERFISIVIDPMILMSGLNISLQTLNLARHLYPAFIRIEGPSTSNVAFSETDIQSSLDSDSEFRARWIVSPSMWISLNTWIVSANLTPVFTLSDRDRVNDAWNPIPTAMPFMEMTDKMNLSCYWELGSGTPNKTLEEYVNDVTALRHILDAFPSSRNSWNIVGGDASHCVFLEHDNDLALRKLITDVSSNVQAVNWNPKSNSPSNFPSKDCMTKALSLGIESAPSVWTTAPRTPKPTGFRDALLWAKHLGEAAKMGYSVIFRQPKVRELFELTPAYWVSMFHKSLMGRNVLDVRASGPNKAESFVYAHCSKRQNRFTRRGAATVFVVNMQNEQTNTSIKLVGSHLRNVEIQSYILTSTEDEDSSEICLNGNLLTIEDLEDGRLEFTPRIRRAKTSKFLTLSLPPKSVGFFVLPGARLTACIHGEEELHLIREEILEDQNEIISNEVQSTEANTEADATNLTNMNELYRMMEEELESNEMYYKNSELWEKTKEWKKLLLEKAKEQEDENQKLNDLVKENKRDKLVKDTMPADMRKTIIERARLMERQKNPLEVEQRRVELKQLLMNKAQKDNEKEELKSQLELNLSSAEIRNILSERARAKKAQKEPTNEMKKLLNETNSDIKKQAESKPAEETKGKTDLLKQQIPVNSRHKRELGALKYKLQNLRNRNIGRFLFNQRKSPSEEISGTEIQSGEIVYADIARPSSDGNENYEYVSDEHSSRSVETIGSIPVCSCESGVFGRDCLKCKLGLSGLSGLRNKFENYPYQKERRVWSPRHEHENINENNFEGQEYFENFEPANINVRDDLKQYGELWEVDGCKDILEEKKEEVQKTKSKEEEDDLKKIKMLLKKYHNEIKSIVESKEVKTTEKPKEEKDKECKKKDEIGTTEISKSETKERKSETKGKMPETKNRKKRDLRERLERLKEKRRLRLKEKSRLGHKIFGEIKQQQHQRKTVHDLKNLIKRTKRGVNIDIKVKDNVHHKEKNNIAPTISSDTNLSTQSSNSEITTHSSNNINHKVYLHHHYPPLKTLKLRLAQQKKMEEKISNYLEKIRETGKHLENEICMSCGSANINTDSEKEIEKEITYKRTQRGVEVDIKVNDRKDQRGVENNRVTTISSVKTSADDADTTHSTNNIKSKVHLHSHHPSLRTLELRLAQQKKMEEKISSYLKKIRETNEHLENEIRRSSRSVNIQSDYENEFGSRSIYKTGQRVPRNVRQHLGNNMNNDIYADNTWTLEKLRSPLKRYCDQYDLILKKRQANYDSLDEEKTKETDDFMNEISKEGKMIPYDEKYNKEDIHKYKIVFPKVNTIRNLAEGYDLIETTTRLPFNDEIADAFINEISKEGRMIYNDEKEKEEDVNKYEIVFSEVYTDKNLAVSVFPELNKDKNLAVDDDFRETNSGIPSNDKKTNTYMNEIPKKSRMIPNYEKEHEEDIYKYKIIFPEMNTNKSPALDSRESTSLLSSTDTAEELVTRKTISVSNSPNEIDKISKSSESSESSFSETDSNENEANTTFEKPLQSKTNINNPAKNHLIDNVFQTVFTFLNDFHSKIVNYLGYLTR